MKCREREREREGNYSFLFPLFMEVVPHLFPWVGRGKTNCIYVTVFSSLAIWVPHPSLSIDPAFAVFSCVQAMVWLPVLWTFNMRTDVDACNCT